MIKIAGKPPHFYNSAQPFVSETAELTVLMALSPSLSMAFSFPILVFPSCFPEKRVSKSVQVELHSGVR